jgi:hypothetical protein
MIVDTRCPLCTGATCSSVHRHRGDGIHDGAEVSGHDEIPMNFLEFGLWSMQHTRET